MRSISQRRILTKIDHIDTTTENYKTMIRSALYIIFPSYSFELDKKSSFIKITNILSEFNSYYENTNAQDIINSVLVPSNFTIIKSEEKKLQENLFTFDINILDSYNQIVSKTIFYTKTISTDAEIIEISTTSSDEIEN